MGERLGNSFVAAFGVAGATFFFVLLQQGMPLENKDVLFAFLYSGFSWFSVFFACYSIYGTIKAWFEEVAERMFNGRSPVESQRPEPRREVLSPRQPIRSEMVGNKIRLVNRLVATDSLLVKHRAEIQKARADGNMPRVGINKINDNTGAKKYGDNQAKELYNELRTAGFIDDNGDWTDTGDTYSLPHPATSATSNDDFTGSNQLQPVFYQ